MQSPARRRLSLPIHTLFIVCQYMGMAFVCLGYPGASDRAAPWPGGPLLPRRALLLWAGLFMLLGLVLDRAWLKALQADLAEEKAGAKGGLHRKTLEALASPVLFILDLLAGYAVLACQREGAAYDAATRLQTASMAIGVVLWIYGRRLPHIPFWSVWGIRTPRANAGVRAWGVVHLRAMPGACLCGLLALAAGAFLPPAPGLGCAALCLLGAFLFMFTRRAD